MCRRHVSFDLLSIAALVCRASASWASSPQQQLAMNMEPLQDPLGDQRARLQNVADLLLTIYQTLADMLYINRSGIEVGPHDMSEFQPIFDKYDLDPAIVYLYSILPYVNRAVAGQSDFYKKGKFADFRSAQNLELGRDPYYVEAEEDADEDYMKPWYTPLSFIGNHYSMLMYDAREHRIWILDQYWPGSVDPVLKDIPVPPDNKNRFDFESVPSRPAEEVLRDINRWYRELEEIPGGDDAGGVWERDDIDMASLYRKNGWPNNFDPEAFRTDQCRKYEASRARSHVGHPLSEVKKYKSWCSTRQHRQEQLLNVLESAESVESAMTTDDMWMAKFDMLESEQVSNDLAEDLKAAEEEAARLCPEGVCQREEDLPLWEFDSLRRAVENMEWRVRYHDEWTTRSHEDPNVRLGQWLKKIAREAEKGLPIYKRALEASKADMDRLCAGRTPESVPGIAKIDKPDLVKKIKRTRRLISSREALLHRLLNWIRDDELPHDAIKTKAAVEGKIQKLERELGEFKDSLHAEETQWAEENRPSDISAKG